MSHSSRSGNDAIKSSGVSKQLLSGIIGNHPEEKPIGEAAACLRVGFTHTSWPGQTKTKRDRVQQCNHKMSTGLPDAGNRRLFRSSMRKPFSRSHCPVPCRGDWALSFYIFSRHQQGSVCAARNIIHRSVIVLVRENTRDRFGQPPRATGLGILSRGSVGLDLPRGAACRILPTPTNDQR